MIARPALLFRRPDRSRHRRATAPHHRICDL